MEASSQVLSLNINSMAIKPKVKRTKGPKRTALFDVGNHPSIARRSFRFKTELASSCSVDGTINEAGPRPTTRSQTLESRRQGGLLGVFQVPQDVGQEDKEQTASVEDVDEEDWSDPQLCSDIVKEIYLYLRSLEARLACRTEFLLGSSVTSTMRACLVDWLLTVHEEFELLQETLHLTVYILDMYMSRRGLTFRRSRFQLLGITAMFMACKYEEMCYPDISEIVYVTNDACCRQEVLEMEVEVLRALDFSLGQPSSLNFLRRYSKVANVAKCHHEMGKYILEACMTSYDLAYELPSKLAAAALMIACVVFDIGSGLEQLGSFWGPTLQFYSGYQLCQVTPTIKKMCTVVLQVPDSKYRAAFLKHSQDSKGRVARIANHRRSRVENLMKSI